MDSVAVRVNSSILPKYAGRTVRLVGTLIGLEGNRAIMETSDKGQVMIHIAHDSQLTQPGVYEVIAKVIDATQVQEISSLAFEGNFGMKFQSQVRCR